MGFGLSFEVIEMSKPSLNDVPHWSPTVVPLVGLNRLEFQAIHLPHADISFSDVNHWADLSLLSNGHQFKPDFKPDEMMIERLTRISQQKAIDRMSSIQIDRMNSIQIKQGLNN